MKDTDGCMKTVNLWERSLHLLLKPPMFCLFVQGHSCWQDSQYYCRETSCWRTRVLLYPSKGRQEWAQKVFYEGISPQWIGAQAKQTWPCHAACSFFATTMRIHSHGIIQTETLLYYLGLQWQRSQSAWSFLVFLCQHDSVILFYDSLTYSPFFDEKLNQYSPSALSTWQMQSELFTLSK